MTLDQLYVMGKYIRYVEIPAEIDVQAAITMQIARNSDPKSFKAGEQLHLFVFCILYFVFWGLTWSLLPYFGIGVFLSFLLPFFTLLLSYID
jgi:hypothetical protein